MNPDEPTNLSPESAPDGDASAVPSTFEDSYFIAWLDHRNGRQGRGTKPFSGPGAAILCQTLNHEHPGIEHVVVRASAIPSFSEETRPIVNLRDLTT